MNTLYFEFLKKMMIIITMLFISGFVAISVNTGMNLFKSKDISHAYNTLVTISKPDQAIDNTSREEQLIQAEAEIVNGVYFKLLREISSIEYAYGAGSYIEPYIVNNNKSNVEKKNFGLHMICGAICLMMAFFQFWPYFRRKFKKVHRVFGSIFILSGLTLCISVWFYLIWSGPEKTYEALTGQVGLYTLSAVTFMSIIISVFYLFKREYNKHIGWMSIALGSLLTAPFQRYDWFVLAYLDTGRTHAVINGFVDSILYTQAYLAAYIVFCFNRHCSPIRKNYKPSEDLSYTKKCGLMTLALFGSISIFYYYFFTQGMIDSTAVLNIIAKKAFIKETQIIFGKGSLIPFIFSLLSTFIMCIGAFVVIKLHKLKQVSPYIVYLYVIAGISLAYIEISWGLQIGYPTMLNSPGGGHYVLWGVLHLLFSVAIIFAHFMNKKSLLTEWVTMLWLLSFSSVIIFWMAGVLSVLNVIPQQYVESRHLAVLLAGGGSELIFLCAMLYAIYGQATQEKFIH